MNFVDACRDENLFGSWFADDSWATWRVIDKAIFGLPLDAAELPVFRELTGRAEPPTEQVTEAWIIAGRRAGKSRKAAAYGAYLATVGAELRGTCARLTRGERGVCQVLAIDRDQAAVVFGYVAAFFEQPMLAGMVERQGADFIDLRNRISIEVVTNNFRRVRGRTVIAAILDETAYWRDERSENPDTEVYAAIKPAMLTIPGALLIGISSPYSRRGLLYRKFSDHFGKDGPVLVVKAPTVKLHPTIDRSKIDEAYAEDPSKAAADYGAEFRSDLEELVSREAVAACVRQGVYERAPERRWRYVGFVDPSGGASDSFSLAISHKEGITAVLDLVRETRAPFSPESVAAEYAELLKRYRISTVHGDRYAGEWPREQFRKHGVHYAPSEMNKSEIYLALVPEINSRAIDLLDNPRLTAQLLSLERATHRGGGRDTIDHPRGSHDDLINAAAGSLVMVPRSDRPRELPKHESSAGYSILKHSWSSRREASNAR